MARRFVQTACQGALALGVAGVGWWLFRSACARRAAPSFSGRGTSARETQSGEYSSCQDQPRPHPEASGSAPACVAAPTSLEQQQKQFVYGLLGAAGVVGLFLSGLLRSRRRSAEADDAVAPGTAAAPSYFLSRWIFLRLLGVVYLAAFLSLRGQVKGLVGRRGILPVADYLEEVRRLTGRECYYLVPTFCWLDASDRALDRLCTAGALLSGLLILGVAPAPVLLLLWADYLSLSAACQRFLGYQWDALLLEAGLHAVPLAPLRLWPRLGREPPPRVALWLLRWLLFRLMLTSGLVKLHSGDPAWRTRTALAYHYETQPLPAWTSWYMHQLPAGFHRLSTWFTLAVELGLPPLMFGPRRCRQLACAGTVLLQAIIAATGNFGFFNLLTVALCVPLLDDQSFPRRWRPAVVAPTPTRSSLRRWFGWLAVPLAAVPVMLSGLELLAACGRRVRGPRLLGRVREVLVPFRSLNTYGLFAVMTTRRPEIIVEGSNDGRIWLPYEFRWKPGDVRRRPAFTGLHMPRLDWQMWFAALGSFWENGWFLQFLVRLLEGSPEVLGLLRHNPFPGAPPRYVRAILYDYRFTDRAARKETGAWWRREALGLYCPILTVANEEARWSSGSPPQASPTFAGN
jgi:hypothetical protein